ncbi:hypothetical protein EDD85DRAFT_798437 [Armillaria nabsnona]|nr:hypothetical protein EDD85DRAFT_798437 [Armillaria nabsnona]
MENFYWFPYSFIHKKLLQKTRARDNMNKTTAALERTLFGGAGLETLQTDGGRLCLGNFGEDVPALLLWNPTKMLRFDSLYDCAMISWPRKVPRDSLQSGEVDSWKSLMRSKNNKLASLLLSQSLVVAAINNQSSLLLLANLLTTATHTGPLVEGLVPF